MRVMKLPRCFILAVGHWHQSCHITHFGRSFWHPSDSGIFFSYHVVNCTLLRFPIQSISAKQNPSPHVYIFNMGSIDDVFLYSCICQGFTFSTYVGRFSQLMHGIVAQPYSPQCSQAAIPDTTQGTAWRCFWKKAAIFSDHRRTLKQLERRAQFSDFYVSEFSILYYFIYVLYRFCMILRPYSYGIPSLFFLFLKSFFIVVLSDFLFFLSFYSTICKLNLQ